MHYEQNFIYLFLNYKSTGVNITNYVVTIFKYQIITGIQSSLETTLYPVLINEIPGTVFFFTNLPISALFYLKIVYFKKSASRIIPHEGRKRTTVSGLKTTALDRPATRIGTHKNHSSIK